MSQDPFVQGLGGKGTDDILVRQPADAFADCRLSLTDGIGYSLISTSFRRLHDRSLFMMAFGCEAFLGPTGKDSCFVGSMSNWSNLVQVDMLMVMRTRNSDEDDQDDDPERDPDRGDDRASDHRSACPADLSAVVPILCYGCAQTLLVQSVAQPL